jgi:hypothetical protein
MIRDGDVGHWPGYDAMRYSLLASPEEAAAARAALSEPPSRMAGWAPPAPTADGTPDAVEEPAEPADGTAVDAVPSDEGAAPAADPQA